MVKRITGRERGSQPAARPCCRLSDFHPPQLSNLQPPLTHAAFRCCPRARTGLRPVPARTSDALALPVVEPTAILCWRNLLRLRLCAAIRTHATCRCEPLLP